MLHTGSLKMHVLTSVSRKKQRRTDKRSAKLEARTLRYLTEISVKYCIEPNLFFDKIVESWRTGKSKCGKLKFVCRKTNKHYAVFLITTKDKVVTQFRLSQLTLLRENPLESFTSLVKIMKKKRMQVQAKKRHGKVPIKDLQVGMKQVTVEAKVLKVSSPRVVATRFGFYSTIANASITDETGIIQLPLWNRQIKEVSMGDFISVENANVIVFRGIRQLKIARNGKIKIINKAINTKLPSEASSCLRKRK